MQRAAYSLLPEDQQQQAHLSIGRLLLKHTSPAQHEERVFDVVNQLNIGISLIHEPAERTQIAQLNLSAGKRARSATAYESAVAYLTAGLTLAGRNQLGPAPRADHRAPPRACDLRIADRQLRHRRAAV